MINYYQHHYCWIHYKNEHLVCNIIVWLITTNIIIVEYTIKMKILVCNSIVWSTTKQCSADLVNSRTDVFPLEWSQSPGGTGQLLAKLYITVTSCSTKFELLWCKSLDHPSQHLLNLGQPRLHILCFSLSVKPRWIFLLPT